MTIDLAFRNEVSGPGLGQRDHQSSILILALNDSTTTQSQCMVKRRQARHQAKDGKPREYPARSRVRTF